MKFVKVDPRQYKQYKTTKNRALIDAFIASGDAMVRLEGADAEYRDNESCVSSLSSSLKRFHISNVKATLIKGEAYLINLSLVGKEEDENEDTED